MTVFRA